MSYIFANPNPLDKMVGDCVVRAISLCEDLSWEEVYLSLCVMESTDYQHSFAIAVAMFR